jgi:hypothetical protein
MTGWDWLLAWALAVGIILVVHYLVRHKDPKELPPELRAITPRDWERR